MIHEKFDGKCHACDIDLKYLPAFHFHHSIPDLKSKIYEDIQNKKYEELVIWAKEEKIICLCANHHEVLPEKAKIFSIFKHLILKENLFKISAENIDNLIKEEIKRKEEEINDMLQTQNKAKIQYEIKKMLRKRYIVENLYDGKCIVCDTDLSMLPALSFHHLDSGKKTINITSLLNMDAEVIIRRIIEEKIICICANHHSFLTSNFDKNIESIANDRYVNSNSVINEGFRRNLNEIYKIINNKITEFIDSGKLDDFKRNLNNNLYKSPLKFVFGRKGTFESWKKHLLIIHRFTQRFQQEIFTFPMIREKISVPKNCFHEKLIKGGYIEIQSRHKNNLVYYKITDKGKKLAGEIEDKLKNIDNDNVILKSIEEQIIEG